MPDAERDGEAAVRALICQENFEFRWVKTPLFAEKKSFVRKMGKNKHFSQHVVYEPFTEITRSFATKGFLICSTSRCDLRHFTS